MTTAKNVLKSFLFLSALLIVLTLAGREVSAGGLILSVEEKEDVRGDRVAVTITAENAAGVEGGQFVFHFDPALIKPVSIEAGALVTDASSELHMANLEYAEGQLMFMWVTALGDTADAGELCTITFDLLGEGETTLEIKDVVISPDDIEETTTDPGRIVITEAEVEPRENEEAVDPREDEEEPEENDEEALVDNGTGTTGFQWLIGVIVLAVLAAVGYVVYKWLKKPGAKH